MSKESKNIYLHIGLHKTGSTTLQVFLKENISQLSSQDYLYPESGLTYYAQQNLAWELLGDERFKKEYGTWKDLHQEIEDRNLHNIILSAEDFEFLDQESINKIKTELERYNTTIIVYLTVFREKSPDLSAG